MKPHFCALAALLALATVGTAHADIKRDARDGFWIQVVRHVDRSPQQTWTDLTRVGQWWSKAHTDSGDAANLSLDAKAGGCFCEHWAGGSVEHARVIAALPGKRLVMQGALGPLQSMAVQGVLSFTLTAQGHGTRVQMDYRVNGSSISALESKAPKVEQVLFQQMTRFAHYADHDKSEK